MQGNGRNWREEERAGVTEPQPDEPAGSASEPGEPSTDQAGEGGVRAAGAADTFRLANPDFSFASLRGNAVLRGEYRSASTFSLVWIHHRSDPTSDGEFEFGRSFHRLAAAHGNHAFAVKFSYWWHP